MKELDFNEWFKMLLDEKGLSNTVIEFDDTQNHTWVHMSIRVIQDYLSFCNKEVQQKFKSKIIELEFCNMNIAHFLEYVAKRIEKARGE